MVDDDATNASVAPRPHRPWLAALLSFAFPGLGQAYSGRRRDAVVFAVPVLLLAGAAVALSSGLAGDHNSLLSRDFLATVMAVNGALLVWRLTAIAHAGLTPTRMVVGRHRRVAAATVVGLLALSVGMHVWVGVVVAHLEDTLSQVFAPALDDRGSPPDSSPATSGDDPRGEGTPEPNRWANSDRINVLLLGSDAAPGRESVLTDVILVISIDPAGQSAVMISVPRDTGWTPLPDESLYTGGLFPGKVNEIAARAAGDPASWCPGHETPEECGLETMERTIGLYLGIEIHHHALIDMAGFADMIDALGGLELCLPGRLIDPEFDGSLENRDPSDPLVLPAGCHQYSGLEALAYARSRKGWIELEDGTIDQQNDFARNERQQEVLLALRGELAEADTLLELPGLIGAIGRTVTTDVPRGQAGDLAGLLPLITGPNIERLVLDYPDFVDLPPHPDAYYILIPRRDAVRDAMADLFGRDELVGWYLGTTDPAPPAELSGGDASQ